MIWYLAGQEAIRRYRGAMAWLVHAAALGLLAWLQSVQLDTYQRIQPGLTAQGAGNLGIGDLVVAPTLSSCALLLLIVVPLLGMSSLAAEARDGRLSYLSAMPLGQMSLLLGKWLGLALAALPLPLLATAMGASLALGTDLDLPRLIATLTMLIALTLFASAMTVAASSFTRSPATAAALAILALALMWLLEDSRGDLGLLALGPRIQAGVQGWIRLSDILWFMLFSATALALAWQRLWRLAHEE